MEKKKVMIGMSGGVDSSVAAALLIEQGYEVVGVTLKLWSEESEDLQRSNGGCCSLDDINDARMVASKLGIPHYVLNFRDVFRRDVVDYFVNEYQEGRTPNPCIACNRYIKFEGLLDKAIAMGFDYIATGHYANIVKNEVSNRYELHRGASTKKDQSYVLYNFTQDQLSHMLMPIGDRTKDETREIAVKYDLAIAKKPDSQEICFVPDQDYAAFIERYTGIKSVPGDFVDRNGKILGKHKGVWHYTIGQRKGLGIAFGVPMFVEKIDVENNTVMLSEENGIFKSTLFAKDLNFIEIEKLEQPMNVQAKIRYSAIPADAIIEPVAMTGDMESIYMTDEMKQKFTDITKEKNKKEINKTDQTMNDCMVKVTFSTPQRAITPGQAVVFYNGESVVGGGTII